LCAPFITSTIALGGCVVAMASAFLMRGRAMSATVAVMLAYACIGVVLWHLEETAYDRKLGTLYDAGAIKSNDPVTLEAVLVRAPEHTPDGVRLRADAKRIIHREREKEIEGRVELFLPLRDEESRNDYHALALGYGTRFRVLVRLKREEGRAIRASNPVSIGRGVLASKLGARSKALCSLSVWAMSACSARFVGWRSAGRSSHEVWMRPSRCGPLASSKR